MATRCEASLTALPEEVLLRIVQHVANAGNADLRSLRAAHSKLRAAADTCAVRVAISPGSLDKADRCGLPAARLAALMQRFPSASRLCFFQGPKRFNAHHPEGTARLLGLMYTWAGAAGPDAAPACWRGVKHVDSCPSTCVPALAALCPRLEGLSISLEDTNGVLYRDTAAALASLTGLTSLRVAFHPTAAPARDQAPQLVEWRPESVAALGALTQLRSLVISVGAASRFHHAATGWVKGLTALTELQLVGMWLTRSASMQLTGLRRLGLEGAGSILLSSQLAGIAAAGLGQLTQLRCSFANRVNEQLPFGPALSAATGLVHLSLPAASLAQGHLEAVASAAPQLTRLEAASIAASGECTAEFPQLRTLAAAFDPGFSYNLALLVPEVRRLELAPSKVDEAAVLAPVAGTLRELALRGRIQVAPLQQYQSTQAHWDADAHAQTHARARHRRRTACVYTQDFCHSGRHSFSWVGWLDLHTCEIHDQLDLTADNDDITIVKDALLTLLDNLSGDVHLAGLSLSVAEQPDAALALVAAAGTCTGLRRLRLRYFASEAPLDRVVALLLYFRNLQELELEEGYASALGNEAFTNSCLDMLEAGRPESLTKVTLIDTWCVTRQCVDAVQRRAAARGWPLEVVLDCSDDELLGARGIPR